MHGAAKLHDCEFVTSSVLDSDPEFFFKKLYISLAIKNGCKVRHGAISPPLLMKKRSEEQKMK
jgi:hypothetical protein